MDDETLCLLPATKLRMMLRSREISATELLESTLRRVESWNPRVNAIVTVTADSARSAAIESDARLVSGNARLLDGIPVVHKDLFAVAGVRTTKGSPIFADWIPNYDDPHVTMMRDAGAVSIGKSNTPEFGAGSQTFNPVFGVTRNPHDLTKTCGGSSGGAAVALATGMAALADGSDVGGSLRNPAAFCGVVGLRPSPGRVPGQPGWPRLGVSGPMGRTVGDVALLLAAMSGPRAGSPLSLEGAPGRFLGPLDRDWAGVRIAWSPTPGGIPVEPEILEVLSSAVRRLDALGAAIDEATPDLSGAAEIFHVLRALAFEQDLGPLYDLHADEMKETVRWNIEAGRRLTGRQVAAADAAHAHLLERVAAFFEGYDYLLSPTTQVLPFDIELEYPTEIAGTKMATYIEWMRSCTDISVTNCPALSIPAGVSSTGLPIGLQVIGPHRDDFGVLQLGYAIQQVLAS